MWPQSIESHYLHEISQKKILFSMLKLFKKINTYIILYNSTISAMSGNVKQHFANEMNIISSTKRWIKVTCEMHI